MDVAKDDDAPALVCVDGGRTDLVRGGSVYREGTLTEAKVGFRQRADVHVVAEICQRAQKLVRMEAMVIGGREATNLGKRADASRKRACLVAQVAACSHTHMKKNRGSQQRTRSLRPASVCRWPWRMGGL